MIPLDFTLAATISDEFMQPKTASAEKVLIYLFIYLLDFISVPPTTAMVVTGKALAQLELPI